MTIYEQLPDGHFRSYKLLGTLQSYAPHNAAQAMCSALYRKAQADGADERELQIAMVGAIGDGLKYGNWPWS